MGCIRGSNVRISSYFMSKPCYESAVMRRVGLQSSRMRRACYWSTIPSPILTKARRCYGEDIALAFFMFKLMYFAKHRYEWFVTNPGLNPSAQCLIFAHTATTTKSPSAVSKLRVKANRIASAFDTPSVIKSEYEKFADSLSEYIETQHRQRK